MLWTINLLLFSGCMTIGSHNDPEYDFKTAAKRLKENPLPETHIEWNDTELAWLHNGGVKFSDSEFKNHVYGLDIAKRAKEIRFISKINRHGKKVIRYAVLYFD